MSASEFYTGCVDCPGGKKNQTEKQKNDFIRREQAKGHRPYGGIQLTDSKKK